MTVISCATLKPSLPRRRSFKDTLPWEQLLVPATRSDDIEVNPARSGVRRGGVVNPDHLAPSGACGDQSVVLGLNQ